MFPYFLSKIKRITASHLLSFIFISFIFYVGFAAIPQFLCTSLSFFQGDISIRNYIDTVDDQYNGMLPNSKEISLLQNKGTYINLNGFMANTMDQRFMNDRVKLKNGNMAELMEQAPDADWIVDIADNIATVYQHQEARGKNFLFVMTPSQISKYEDLLPTGYVDTINDTADLLLKLLAERGIECLDLRENFAEDGLVAADTFFKTDHHWLPQTGFWAYTKVLDKLQEMGIFSRINTAYTDADSFHFHIYEDSFLGSCGKRTGMYYAGVDDFCVIEPKFDTNITVKYEGDDIYYQGTYADTVNTPIPQYQFEARDYFNFYAYDMYGHSDTFPVLRINENAPEQTRLLMIGDSMNNVPFSLMSLYASHCYELDMRVYTEDFPQFYEEYAPDTVIFMINPRGCADGNTYYPFFESETK